MNRYSSNPSVSLIDSGEPREVQIAFDFLKISDIDTMKEQYGATLQIEAKWIDNEVAFDEKLDDFKYNPETNWHPKLFIENLLTEQKQQINYEVIESDEDENLMVKMTINVKGIFWERLELNSFPLDIQELSIVLASELSFDEIKLVADNNKMSGIDLKAVNTFTESEKWTLYKMVRLTNDASYDSASLVDLKTSSSNLVTFTKLPKIVGTCIISRKPSYYFLNGYLLIFLFTIASFFMFVEAPSNSGARLGSVFGLILTSLSFKFVVNRSLPTVSYLTSLDKYSSICLCYLILVAMYHSIIGSDLLFKAKDEDTQKTVDEVMIIIFAFIFIAIHVVLFIWISKSRAKVRALKKEEQLFLVDYIQKLKEKND